MDKIAEFEFYDKCRFCSRLEWPCLVRQVSGQRELCEGPFQGGLNEKDI